MDYKNECNSDDDFDCSNSYGDSYNNNNSNSGYNTSGGHLSNPNGLSKAELRKTNKPIMEKRRRARINHCLNELKSLILEAMKKDPARHTKLEKADILEMTVKHLQSVQRQQLNMAIQTDPSVIHKFKTGFVECSEEVNRYISQLDGVDVGVRQRLTNHLTNCATNLEQIGSMTNFNNGYRGQLGANGLNPAASLFGAGLGNPLATAVTTPATGALFPPLPQDLNNNTGAGHGNPTAAGAPIQMGGVHLIPSRLPSGEFALIMPNTAANSAGLLNTNNNNNNQSPFATWRHAAASATKVATQLPATGNSPLSAINEFSTNLSAFSKPPHQPPQKLHTTLGKNSGGFNTASTTAFHQPQNNLHHNSTATTSPPLSPISSSAVSVSSHGDDSSLMHTSSDFPNSRPSTPPHDSFISAARQQNFSGVFSTPPNTSAESSLSVLQTSASSTASSPPQLQLQQQQQEVSSTSGGGGGGIETSATRLKRSLSDAADSSDSLDEPASKKYQVLQTQGEKCGEELETSDNCWRPW